MDHKKNGSWNMFVDYRELKNITIKDKFRIPAIDKLLNELHGVVYYTMLDLYLRYHQIKMKEEYIPKTRFKTHECHYEFGHAFFP